MLELDCLVYDPDMNGVRVFLVVVIRRQPFERRLSLLVEQLQMIVHRLFVGLQTDERPVRHPERQAHIQTSPATHRGSELVHRNCLLVLASLLAVSDLQLLLLDLVVLRENMVQPTCHVLHA